MTDIREILRAHANDYEAHLEKEVAKRFQVLCKSSDLFSIYHKFGGDVFRRSSVMYGLDDFMLEIGGRQTGNCLEIGTCNGLTAVVLSRYFNHVWSIDIEPSDYKQAIVDYLGIKNITFITKPNDAQKNIWIDDFKKTHKIDFAFLDGDHAKYTKSDFEIVQPCKRILFDECWPPQPAVYDLVQSLRGKITYGAFRMAYWDGR